MRERDIARTEFKVALQKRRVGADHISIFNTDQRSDLSALVDALHVIRGFGQFNAVRIHLGSHPADGVEFDQRETFRLGVVLGRALGLPYVDNPKPCIQAAFLHLRQIDLEVAAHSGIHRGSGKIKRNVDMRVESQHAIMDRLRLLLESRFIGVLYAAGGKTKEYRTEEQLQHDNYGGQCRVLGDGRMFDQPGNPEA